MRGVLALHLDPKAATRLSATPSKPHLIAKFPMLAVHPTSLPDEFHGKSPHPPPRPRCSTAENSCTCPRLKFTAWRRSCPT
jgi:hypothetical protein